jgi:outer membrane protein OmpA-like peptidoglycan-associated protein
MKRAAIVNLLSIAFFWGFAGKNVAQTGQAPQTPNTEPSLVSFSAGALVVQKPQEYSDGWSAFNMLDENPQTGWATPKGVTTNQVTVIELQEKTLLKRLEFDIAGVDGPKRGAKDVDVEMSDTSATSGFQKIASVTLRDAADRQQFPVSASVPGRWVRLTAKDNQGSPDYIEIMDFRGYGTQLTHTPFPNVSGTYDTNYGKMHLLQQGTSVTGCYEHGGGLLTGGVEGRIMRFTWTQDGNLRGPAVMVFSPDGNNLLGLWWNEGQENAQGGLWKGPKVSTTVGACPNWKGVGTENQIANELEQFGRSRVYGINFDSDSDHIKDESKPTLDKIVAMLKAKPDWKLTIEGHTDSTSTAAHNQDLSERRAAAVKTYLVAAGIDGARLSSAGFGATRPVAANDTALGRSQNRRVELTKN